MNALALDRTAPAHCDHRRVRDSGPAKVVKGAPDGSTRAGYHVSQGGVCYDCGLPVLRLSPHVALGEWESVSGRAIAGARRVQCAPERRRHRT